MTKLLEKIEYKVYRGHLEPIVQQTAAEINLYPNHIEIIYNYTFTKHDTKIDDTYRCAITINKSQVSVGTTTRCLDADPEKKEFPIVEVYVNGSYVEDICVETEKEAFDIYKKIKTWLIQ